MYATCLTYFVINGEPHLMVGHYQNSNGSTTLASPIFKWDPLNNRFGYSPIQTINTYGVRSLLSFYDTNQHYLVVANHFDSVTNRFDIS